MKTVLLVRIEMLESENLKLKNIWSPGEKLSGLRIYKMMINSSDCIHRVHFFGCAQIILQVLRHID